MSSEFWYILLTAIIIIMMVLDLWVKWRQLKVWEKMMEKKKE